MDSTDSIKISQIADALMRSDALAHQKIKAIKILRDASRDASGQISLGLKESKEHIDAAAARVAFEVNLRQRELLASNLLRALEFGNDTFDALMDYQSHVASHGLIPMTVKALPPATDF